MNGTGMNTQTHATAHAQTQPKRKATERSIQQPHSPAAELCHRVAHDRQPPPHASKSVRQPAQVAGCNEIVHPSKEGRQPGCFLHAAERGRTKKLFS